jgi:hypothetical protein
MQLSLKTLAVAAAVLAFAVSPAFAEQIKFTASLVGTSEVPPTDSAATGTVEATLDTDTKGFTYKVTYEGLSGDASAAHFHGPAQEGENAAPVVPIEGALASPIEGTATLDDAQIADLQAGLWYFNVHTAKFPDGEVRGQLAKAAM